LDVIVNGGEAIFDGPLVASAVNSLNFFIGANGRLRYEPISDPAPASTFEPSVYFDGLLDISRSNFSIKFNRRIQGVLGNLSGTPGDIEEFAPLGVEIDLSKDYP
jgi:hypothetical protein